MPLGEWGRLRSGLRVVGRQMLRQARIIKKRQDKKRRQKEKRQRESAVRLQEAADRICQAEVTRLKGKAL